MKNPLADFDNSISATFMDKVKNATDLYNQGYLCSQSVFAAFCEDYGIDKVLGLKLSKFLGFGYLFRGEYCGAISAAMMIYGLKYSSGCFNLSFKNISVLIRSTHRLQTCLATTGMQVKFARCRQPYFSFIIFRISPWILFYLLIL